MKKLLTLVFAVSVFFCQSQSISIKYLETVDISSEIDAMEMPDDLGGLSAMFIKQLISSSMDKPSQFELLSKVQEISMNDYYLDTAGDDCFDLFYVSEKKVKMEKV